MRLWKGEESKGGFFFVNVDRLIEKRTVDVSLIDWPTNPLMINRRTNKLSNVMEVNRFTCQLMSKWLLKELPPDCPTGWRTMMDCPTDRPTDQFWTEPSCQLIVDWTTVGSIVRTSDWNTVDWLIDQQTEQRNFCCSTNPLTTYRWLDSWRPTNWFIYVWFSNVWMTDRLNSS